MADSSTPLKLWEPTDPKSTQMYEFMQAANSRHQLKLSSFRDLYKWSIEKRTDFWSLLFDRAGFIYEGDYRPGHGGGGVVDESQPIDAVPRWFDGVRLNFAENILYTRANGRGNNTDRDDHEDEDEYAASTSIHGTRGKEDDRVAVTAVREGAAPLPDNITWGELRRRAGELAQAMATRAGVGRGDRVVLVGANSTETLLVWLATAWLGALFCSSSADTGVAGILQRSAQVRPRLLFMDDAAVYGGRTVDLRPKMAAVAAGLHSSSTRRGGGSGSGPGSGPGSLSGGVVAIPRFADRPAADLTAVRAAVPLSVPISTWQDFLAVENDSTDSIDSSSSKTPQVRPPPPFCRVDFSDPLLVCFSSGTTGPPKAIVHSVGGVMLNYYKEACLHEDLRPDAVSLQYTTVGWIMYAAVVGVLLFGCRSVLYDGSPFHPDRAALLRLAADQRVTKLGSGPRWLLEMSRLSAETVSEPGSRSRSRSLGFDLSALRSVTSTGTVLSPELQRWFYSPTSIFSLSVKLDNISGGTDIAGCFGCGNPLTPVYEGGAQGPGLGIDVRLFDSDSDSDSAQDGFLTAVEVPAGTPGELVAVAAFPNLPCFFWNDPGSGRAATAADSGRMVLRLDRPAAPPGSRYHDAYFARFRHVWAHGDFCVFHPLTGQLDFLGRADGVLNPSGVRFGSAEIYAVIDRHFADRIADSLCVGQRRPGRDHDESVILFLLLHPGAAPLDRPLAAAIRAAIARDLSKRHVPRYIFPTPAIPTTVNMKKVELPVKRIVSGHTVQPSSTLVNPESLDYFYRFADIENLLARGDLAKL